MNRRNFLHAAAAGVGCSLFLRSAAASAGPNVIIILADDLGYGELGCYGNSFNQTPCLNNLAQAGVRFTNAYSSAPVCSPTRAALLSGRWPQQCGITDYLRPWADRHIPSGFRLLPEALRNAGYRTGLIGKWHLTGYRLDEGYPDRHGFDEVVISENRGIGSGDYFYPYRFNPDIDKWLPGREHLVDRMNLEAVDFIDRHREHPFFLLLSHYAVHTTLHGRRDLVHKYRRRENASFTRFASRNNPHLAAQLEVIDQGVGMIEAKLEQTGIRENTAVIFVSDNGGEVGVANNGELRAGKSHLYEGGIRVPMIVRAGRETTGKVCSTPLSTIDMFPTILDMAGLDRDQSLGGNSFMPCLADGSGALPDRSLYWHYPLDRSHFLGGRSSGAVRRGRWKLIEFYDSGERELYDLEIDPGETRNLLDQEPATAARLYQDLRDWRAATGAAE